MSVPATTVNKVCLSGLNAIYLADLMIRAGEAEVVVAGGMESMTQAPHLLPGARAGYRIGDGTVVDSMMFDGLYCAVRPLRHGARHRAATTSKVGITRERQDAFAAALATSRRPPRSKEGRLAEEIVAGRGAPAQGRPVAGRHRRGRAPGHHRRVAWGR